MSSGRDCYYPDEGEGVAQPTRARSLSATASLIEGTMAEHK